MDYKKWSFGKVYLFNFNDGYNQKWKIEGNQIICKGFQTSMQSDLRLDGDLMKVGVRKKNGFSDQKWNVRGEKNGKICVINNVHQYKWVRKFRKVQAKKTHEIK